MRKKLLILVLAPLLALGLAWCVGVGTPGTMNLPRPFNSAKWKAADVPDSYVRCSMVADLRHRVGLVGRTEAEIIELLGPPDAVSNGLPLYYGLCPSYMDVYVLEIEWENGRVASTFVRDT